jgi:hypothetical protein
MNRHGSKKIDILFFLFLIEIVFSFFREYLKGFHKRKLERRERAQQELENEIKSDLKILRQKVNTNK